MSRLTRYLTVLCCLALLATALSTSPVSAQQFGQPAAPNLWVEAGQLQWTQPDNGVDVRGHNIHRGDGSYVTTVNGANSWDPQGDFGEYFITAFDQSPTALFSDRSQTVQVSAGEPREDPPPADVAEPALPDGFRCGNWPPVASGGDPVTSNAQAAATDRCGEQYESQDQDRCDWMNEPAGWRCMIREGASPTPPPPPAPAPAPAPTPPPSPTPPPPADVAEPALPDGFRCGNWPPVASGGDPVTSNAQAAATDRCGEQYESQDQDRCDWINEPAGWRCMIRDQASNPTPPPAPTPPPSPTPPSPADVAEPALPDGFRCGNWPPVASGGDPVTSNAQAAATDRCGEQYESQDQDRCDWINEPAGWRCMIRDQASNPDTPDTPSGPDPDSADPDSADRDTTVAPPMPFDVRIRNGRLEWQMPAGPSYVYQVTTNNSTIADGQPWTQREVQSDPALTSTVLANGDTRFSYPVGGFVPGTTFRIEAMHPWDIEVSGPRSTSSRFATIPPTTRGATISDFLGTFDSGGSSSLPGDWIGDQTDWSTTPQFVDDFSGNALSSAWYFADGDIQPDYNRDDTYTRDRATVANGQLAMSVDNNTGAYSYIGTANNSGSGYHIDASNGVFLEASVRLDQASPADNAWWAFWLMNPDGGAYDGNADTGTEVDIFEFVPDQNNGFHTAVYRSFPSTSCPDPGTRNAVLTPEVEDCFAYDSPGDIAGVNAPNYMDGEFHRLGLYYAHDRYAFYIDNTLIWQVTDPAFITKAEELSIRLSWELQNQNNPWTPEFGGSTTSSARDDDPTVFVDWVKVWEKTGTDQPPTEEPPVDDPDLEVPPTEPEIGNGEGFIVAEIDSADLVEEFGLEGSVDAEVRAAMGDTTKVVTITNLRGVRDAGLPEWSQLDALYDAGYLSWAEVPDSALDRPIEPFTINVDLAFVAAEGMVMGAPINADLGDLGFGDSFGYRNNPGPGGIYTNRARGYGLCSSWKSGTTAIDASMDLGHLDIVSLPGLPDGFDAEFDLDLAGVATLEGSVSYRYKRIRTLCAVVAGFFAGGPVTGIAAGLLAQIPYKWDLTTSNITATIETEGELGLGMNLAYTYTEELLKKRIRVGGNFFPFQLLTGVFLTLDLDYFIDLALTFEATVSAEIDGDFTQKWRVDGGGTVAWSCARTDCTRTTSEAEFDVTSFDSARAQASVDLKLTASAGLTADFDVNLHVIDPSQDYFKFLDIAKGQFGIVAQLPIRYFGTIGNNCSDADGDGEYEFVQGQMVDVNLEVYAFVRGALLDGGVGQLIPLNLDWDWVNKRLSKPLLNFDFNVLMYERNLYFSDRSPLSGSTPFQPVLGRSGTWIDDDGAQVSGVEILGTRDCYPLTARPMYLVDWGDGTTTETRGGTVRHNWPEGGDVPVRVRLLRDDARRTFRSNDSAYVTTRGRIGLTPPTTPPGIRSEVYSSTAGAVEWERATDDQGVVGYEVVRDGVSLGVFDRLSWIEGQDEDQLPVGVVFTYEVYAVDVQGARSLQPAVTTLDFRAIEDVPKPDTPEDFRVSSKPGGVLLTWTRGYGIAGYDIYRDGVNIATVTGDQYVDVVPDGSYSYHIAAFIRGGELYSDRTPAVAVLVRTPDNPNAGSDRPELPDAVVSLGDSFIAGEAGRWEGNATTLWGSRYSTDRAYRGGLENFIQGDTYDPGRVYEEGTENDGGCHRSDVAPIRSAQIPGVTSFNLACSGAVSDEVRSEVQDVAVPQLPQVDRLGEVATTHDIELVVLSIGGNDLGFADIIKSCFARFIGGQNPCNESGQRTIDENMPAMKEDLGQTIDDIRATLAEEGDTQYRFVVVSYPSIIPRGDDYFDANVDYDILGIATPGRQAVRETNGCPFYDKDADWARDELVPQIDRAIEEVARGRQVEFLSLANAFDGKEVCSSSVRKATSGDRDNPAAHEWIRMLAEVQGSVEESMHPNAYGQQAIGRCLELLWGNYGPTVHRCTNLGAGPREMRLTSS